MSKLIGGCQAAECDHMNREKASAMSRVSGIRRQQRGLNGRGFKVTKASAKFQGSFDRREEITAGIRMVSSVNTKTIAAASLWLHPLGDTKGGKTNLINTQVKQKIYQIDAFTDRVFSGNPAAVCPLNQWPADDILQKIAMENNLPETAFYTKQGDQYHIRWFTPTVEVDLCGHATLAAAFVLFNCENHKENRIHFYSPKIGELIVTKQGELLTLNFPTDLVESVELSKEITDCFDIRPLLAFKGRTDYMLVFDNEDEIKNISHAIDLISKLNARGVMITAKGKEVDFVCRFFAPQSGIDEDPVTGSAYTTLAPYWAKQLGKSALTAIQLSPRKGHILCTYLNDRVEISGKAALYLAGEIYPGDLYKR